MNAPPKTENINFFILTMVRNNKRPSEIYELLTTAWGENNIKSERHVRRLVQEFEEGERENCKRKIGSGRPRTSVTPAKIEEVRLLLQDDPHLSKSALSNLTDISETSLQRIITKELNMHSVHARWIPHKLSDQQKLQRLNGAAVILEQINGTVMVIDEKWLYKDPSPCRQNVRAWVGPHGDRPEVPRRIIADDKFHIIVACNFRGEHYYEILPRGQNINAERYIQFLTHLQEVRRCGHMTIMHDNARPHKAIMTEEFLRANGIERIP